MPQLDLHGGAYQARSLIADAQRQLNLYAESNPNADPELGHSPYTYYPTPGLRKLGECPNRAPFRGMVAATDGKVYAVVGQRLYFIKDNWEFVELAVLNSARGPVKMVDNGIELAVVDGPYGYRMNLVKQEMLPSLWPHFLGSDHAAFVDTFLVFNRPGTGEFYASDSMSTEIRTLSVARKISYPDIVMGVAVVDRDVWVVGAENTEIWRNTGGTVFPFEIVQGAYIPHGTVASHSIATLGSRVFWLSRDKNGQALVVMGAKQQGQRISTRAIEYEFEQYEKLDDAIGMTYQFNGHACYMITFPTAGKTWVFDVTEELWWEEAWTDVNGHEFRHRANAMTFGYGRNLVGDRQNGLLYELDPDAFDNDGVPIKRVRTFPYIMSEGKRLEYTSFIANMEVGHFPSSAPKAWIGLRMSDDRGRTWSNALLHTLGATGEYETAPVWRRLGTARDRVFELSWSIPVQTALNGAFIELVEAET